MSHCQFLLQSIRQIGRLTTAEDSRNPAFEQHGSTFKISMFEIKKTCYALHCFLFICKRWALKRDLIVDVAILELLGPHDATFFIATQ